MRIKSYFARGVDDAIAMARQELGTEAMLVNTRRTGPEARHLGEYEVVFAVTQSSGAVPSEPYEAEPAATERLSLELAELRHQLEGVRNTISRSALAMPHWPAASSCASDLFASLVAADVGTDLAQEVVQAAEARAGSTRSERAGAPADREALEQAVIEEMQSRFSVKPALGLSEARPRVAAFVGPPGAGKTTTIAKLAVHYGLTARRPVMLLSLDNYRVAGSDQLRSYAAILGVPFQALETPHALTQAIEEGRGKDLILVDTPGFGFPEMEDAGDLARCLTARSDIDTHLVLPASMKPGDLSRVASAFEIFRPGRLLFTRLDETASFGPLFQEAVRSGKPLSFFGTGQRIPEDLETADKGRLAARVLSRRSVEVLSAA